MTKRYNTSVVNVSSDGPTADRLWRQMFCCWGSKAAEQPSSSSETNWH